MNVKYLIITAISFSLLIIACNDSPQKNPQKEEATITIPFFNKDSAFQFVKNQTDFGPRVPNTAASLQCVQYLIATLQKYCDTVYVQPFQSRAFDGSIINGKNIIGAFNPEKTKRVFLASHWDSRPFADYDSNPENHQKAIDGANDGASGVGVLLEIARVIQKQRPNVGIDIVLFDAEDYGPTHDMQKQNSENYWGLGSQYWAANPHLFGYKAAYGILLDMVGDKNARFYKERLSQYFAPQIVEKVWNTAAKMGYSNYFIDADGGYITDDHYFVNEIAKIPTIDIIHYDASPESNHNFVYYWHTMEDNIEKIDPTTLNVVGNVVLQVIFEEK
ncbi:MAG: M28 family peptidase [Bacteroidales bacterium]|nr:M28 family peptidase [Bacteroidales bacterium]